MHVIHARNVNDAYTSGIDYLMMRGSLRYSRAGEVMVADTPVTTVYDRPQERVLFDPNRDANPFFHLLESVWMLAGEQDARWLDEFVSDFSSRFAEEDGHAHGAYGHRWRRHFHRFTETDHWPIDQLLEATSILMADPDSRQAVIAMWDPSVDLRVSKRDIPCNDMIMLRSHPTEAGEWTLDVTVLCRSNDAIWGAYGANAVHMSVMAEVVAALSGMRLGRYYQVSNNFHAYTSVVSKVWRSLHESRLYDDSIVQPAPIIQPVSGPDDRSRARSDAMKLLIDCAAFVQGKPMPHDSQWLRCTVEPMRRVHGLWRAGRYDEAFSAVSSIESSDWSVAAGMWMTRRMERAGRPLPETRSA